MSDEWKLQAIHDRHFFKERSLSIDHYLSRMEGTFLMGCSLASDIDHQKVEPILRFSFFI